MSMKWFFTFHIQPSANIFVTETEANIESR